MPRSSAGDGTRPRRSVRLSIGVLHRWWGCRAQGYAVRGRGRTAHYVRLVILRALAMPTNDGLSPAEHAEHARTITFALCSEGTCSPNVARSAWQRPPRPPLFG